MDLRHMTNVLEKAELFKALQESNGRFPVAEPELPLKGGSGGGTVVVQGTPEDVAACEASHTGRYLARLLSR